MAAVGICLNTYATARPIDLETEPQNAGSTSACKLTRMESEEGEPGVVAREGGGEGGWGVASDKKHAAGPGSVCS